MTPDEALAQYHRVIAEYYAAQWTKACARRP